MGRSVSMPQKGKKRGGGCSVCRLDLSVLRQGGGQKERHTVHIACEGHECVKKKDTWGQKGLTRLPCLSLAHIQYILYLVGKRPAKGGGSKER